MNELRLTLAVVVLLLLAVFTAGAEEKKAKPVDPPAVTDVTTQAIPDANKVKLLQAQHELDDIASKQKDLQLRSQQLYDQILQSPQAKQLQTEGEALNQQQQAARAKLDAAKVEAVKASGADPAKVEVAPSLMELAAKPSGPPAAPNPQEANAKKP